MINLDSILAESVSTTNAPYFVLVYILVLIYCCFGLAVVCDVYFVPALQKLSYTYDLPPDIAGSTLMALGASVPELFASLIGVFITEDDIGTGSIIGSSCFNLIAVPAACAFVASATFTRKLTVSAMPAMRNSAFYAITILVLLLIIKDNKVDMLEAFILLLFFVMYMALMIFSAHTKSSSSSSLQSSSLTSSYISTDSAIAECNNNSDKSNVFYKQPQHAYGQFYFAKVSDQNETTAAPIASNYANNITKSQTVNERTPLVPTKEFNSNNSLQNKSSYVSTQVIVPQRASNQQPGFHDQVCLDSVSLNLGIAIKNSTCLVVGAGVGCDVTCTFAADGCCENLHAHQQEQRANLAEHGHEENWVSSKWILVPMLPVTLSMRLLTPCKFKTTCWTIWTFLVSVALIGGLTYVSVWMVHLFGQFVGIPETIAGMTILSWGTGIPELIASIVLIKKTAQADMAICNTIGSNVIDVSFCLSLPWIVKCIMNKTEGLKPEVSIQSEALPWTCCTLLLSVGLLLLILKLHNWELSFSVGFWLLAVYCTFVVLATYLEYSFSEKGLDLLSLF